MRIPRFLSRFTATTLRVLSPRERHLLVGSIALLIVGIVWACVVLINNQTTLVAREGGVYREGVIGQPRYVTPVLARTNDVDMMLSRLVYAGLMKLTSTDTVEGDLAESVDVSDEGKLYTIKLREGLRWQDNEALTADDVVFTFQTIQNPDTKSPAAPSFQGVIVKKVDDRTVTFTLREPYAPFIYNLTIGIIPQHVWASIEPKNMALAEQNLKPIGSGPFLFQKLRKRSLGELLEFELTRFDGYHGQRPYLEGITFTFFQSQDELTRAFRRRSIDGMSFVSPSAVPDLTAMRHVNIHRVKLPQYFAIFFNQARNAALADKSVRTALDLATDRERLIREALHGEGIRADAPIPAGFLGHAESTRTAQFAPDTARQNLDDAGWKDGNGDGIREKGDVKLAFGIVTTDWPEYIRTAELLAESWRAIGADVTVDPKTVGTVQTDVIRPRNYDALLYGQVLGADPDPYPFWHSTQTRDPGLNLALYKNRDADKFLEDARKTTDTRSRSDTYVKFQETLLADLPAIFLYSPLYTYATHDSVRGEMLEALPLPSERFTTVSSWYMRTRRVWK